MLSKLAKKHVDQVLSPCKRRRDPGRPAGALLSGDEEGGCNAVNENLDKEAVSDMGGIVHCDACSDGQQHLGLK